MAMKKRGNTEGPRYAQVGATLRERILAGRWTAGDVLPTEAELGREFAVSRITIRQALALLDEEGLIRRQRGSGTYVSPRPTRRIPLRIDYTGSVRAHAPRLERKVLVMRRQPVSSGQAGPLKLDSGSPVLYVERLDWIGTAPVAYDQGAMVMDFGDILTSADLARVDFMETWSRRQGIEIETCRQTVEAVPASSLVADRLGLKTGVPVLRSTELYSVKPSQPAGVFVSYYHPEHICIACTYHWGRTAPRT